jgi:hypothetical protein
MWYMLRKTNKYSKNIYKKHEPTNNYGLSNDQIWTLFSKVFIIIIFYWINDFIPSSMSNSCLIGVLLIYILLVH